MAESKKTTKSFSKKEALLSWAIGMLPLVVLAVTMRVDMERIQHNFNGEPFALFYLTLFGAPNVIKYVGEAGKKDFRRGRYFLIETLASLSAALLAVVIGLLAGILQYYAGLLAIVVLLLGDMLFTGWFERKIPPKFSLKELIPGKRRTSK